MIVVTGANGFIGSALVWQLNVVGRNDILCVDSLPLKAHPKLLANKSYEQFLLKNEFLESLREKNFATSIDWILHMGACSSTTEMDVDFLRENNTEYTKKLFELCSEYKIPFIYASSGAVYGAGERGFNDQTPPKEFSPLNPYGRSKSEFDCWVVGQKQMPPLWYGLRFFNVYGPGEYFKEDMSSVVLKAYNQIKRDGSLKLFRSHNPDFEDGKQLRDFVYIKDVTRWIVEIMDKKITSGIYNMGFGKARTWLDLATDVFKNLEAKIKIEWIDVPNSIRDKYQYFTEARMSKLFGQGLSAPQWSLEDGIKDYVINYLEKDKACL